VRRPTQDHRIVIAGAGYAGLHVALRLATKSRDNPAVELILVDRHDYHQALTELPRVAAGTRAADAVRIPLQRVLRERPSHLDRSPDHSSDLVVVGRIHHL
jgi:NADH dehydrogenase